MSEDAIGSLYRAVIDGVSVVVFRTDEQGRWTFLSPAWTALTGLDPDHCIGDASFRLMHPDDRDAAAQVFAKVISNRGREYRHSARYRDARGDWRWAQARIRGAFTSCGRFYGAFGTIDDINTRRIEELAADESKERLHEANRRLTLAESIAHVGHWRSDPSATQVDWSDETYRIFGFDAGRELSVETALHLYHPADRQRVADALAALRLRREPMSLSARALRDDGSVRYVAVEGRAVCDAAGDVVELCGVCKDVTQHVEAEAAVRESEMRYRLLAENITDLIICYDADGVCSYASPAITGMTGYSAEEIVGVNIVAAVHPDDRKVVDQPLADLVMGNVDQAVAQFRWRRKEGQWLWLEARSRLMRSEESSRPTVISVVSDISERHALEVDLIAAKELAEAGGRAKSDFLAMMSHELRTPMTGVLGMIDLLRLDPTPAERERYFETLESSAKTMMLVVDDILDYSKIEAGRLSLETVDFDIERLAREVVAMYSHTASTRGVSINLSIDRLSQNANVRGDPTRIRQILSNLVSNATKFTERGSIFVRVSALTEPDQWRFSVEDSGIGMTEEQMARLFEAFSQADGTTTRRFGGTGLGLAICKRLVVAMGGDIGVESKPGNGSTFWFELQLPQGQDGDVGTPAPTSPYVAAAAPLSILLAEDNPVNQLLITSILTKMGHEITCVENGLLAVEAAREGKFDVILMDMQMPVMDGPEATRAIRELAPPASDTPIVALTADALMRQPEVFEPLGLSGYLAKPINVQLLRTMLDSFAPPISVESAQHPFEAYAEGTQVDLPLFDEGKLKELRTELDSATVDELLAIFSRDLDAQIGTVTEAVGLNQHHDARRAAHAIKGAAGSMAASRLEQAALHAERALEAEEGSELALSALLAASEATKLRISALIGIAVH